MIGLLRPGGILGNMASSASVPPEMAKKVEAVRLKVETLVKLEHEETALLKRLEAKLLARGKAP